MMLETFEVNGQQMCLPCSPGGRNASDVLDGDSRAVVKELLFAAERAGLICAGLYVTGFRGREVLRGTIGATLAMEAFVFGYVLFQRARKRE